MATVPSALILHQAEAHLSCCHFYIGWDMFDGIGQGVGIGKAAFLMKGRWLGLKLVVGMIYL